MKIDFFNFKTQWKREKAKLLPFLDKVISKGDYVGIKCHEVVEFEKKISKYLNVKHTISLNSGTDAITLGLHAAGIKRGDEVITTSNSFIASTGSIVHLGAKPVFVDVLPNYNIDPKKIIKAITKNTKAILVVHLTGRSCDMKSIMKISKKFKIKIIEDCAQAFGSRYYKKFCGTFGEVGCFSTHPLKNFNSMGDGGFITTNNSKIAKYVGKLRNHGLIDRNKVEFFGYNSRLDNIQAAILNFRLKNINKLINKRRKNAKYFINNLNNNHIFCPSEGKGEFNTYQVFVIQTNKRDKLKKYLLKKGIPTYIHYPIPIHKHQMFKNRNISLPVTEKLSKKILSLPVHNNLSMKKIEFITKTINSFFKNEKKL